MKWKHRYANEGLNPDWDTSRLSEPTTCHCGDKDCLVPQMMKKHSWDYDNYGQIVIYTGHQLHFDGNPTSMEEE